MGEAIRMEARRVTLRNGRQVEVRECVTLEEMADCVRLQGETWGYEGNDIIPRRAFIVARHIGGQVIGAFMPEGGRMVGFAMALPGVKERKAGESRVPAAYLHSHMLAVEPEWRDSGLGQRLKLAQREEALARGIDRMEWTFDPLEGKNAHLNIHRLGVVARRYLADFYGVSSSRLQNGLPTDRLLAEWHLDSKRVASRIGGDSEPLPPVKERIMIPAAMSAWKAAGEVARAREVQEENRKQFERAFAAGLAVVGFVRDEQGNGIYELAEWTG
ncbi:MAG: GNAT family N-acetyltransferase [Acidobacteriaceae bacterium]